MKPLVLCSFVVMATMSTGLAAGAASDSQRAFLDDEAILAAWESTYASIRTMSVSFVHQLVDFQPPPMPSDDLDGLPPPAPFRHPQNKRIEDGKRHYERRSRAEGSFEAPEWVEYAFDGKVSQSYSSSTRTAVISPGLTGASHDTENFFRRVMCLMIHNTPDVLRDEYPNGIPELSLWFRLGKLRGKLIVRPRLESVAGESCHVVEAIDDSDIGGKPRELKTVYWMAHDKGMCLMKYQMLKDSKLEAEITIERTAVVEMDGNKIWYPQNAHMTTFRFGTIKYEVTVTDFVPNVEVDDSTFRLAYPPGTRVSDRVLGLSYVVGGGYPNGGVSTVHDISSAEKKETSTETMEPTAAGGQSSPDSAIEKAERLADRDMAKEEGPVPDAPPPDEKKILGVQSLSILGVVALGGLGLLLWHRRSAKT